MKGISQLDRTNNSSIKQSAKSFLKTVLRKAFMSKRYIILQNVRLKDDYTVAFDYSVSDNMRKYFRLEKEFFIRYDFKIDEVPKSILAIPFMTNVMPVAWLADAVLFAPEVDAEFAENINGMRRAFRKIHPKLNFRGKIKINKIVKNNYKTSNRVAMGLSGGVDSLQTFTSHFSESPSLITLIGSDIFFDDRDGVKKLINNTRAIAERYDRNFRIIKSNFRGFLNEAELNELTVPTINDNYWHAVQHGIGIIGNIAPVAYYDKLRAFYFSSTFTERELKNRVSCSSYPVTDESVRLSKCKVIHDGFEFTRQEKIHNIVEFSRKHAFIPLRVCWRSRGAKNCSRCEKCFRTMVGLIAETENPNNYGFNYSHRLADKIYGLVKINLKEKTDFMFPVWWSSIQSAAKRNKVFLTKEYPELKWFLEEKI